MTRHPEPGHRSEATKALGRLGSPASVDGLVERLKSDHCWIVRRDAATALGAIDDPTHSAAGALIDAVAHDADHRVRCWAMDSLRRRPSREAIPVLQSRVESGSSTEQWYAVRALIAANHRSALPALIDNLADLAWGTHTLAVDGIEALADARDVDRLSAVAHGMSRRRRRRLIRLADRLSAP